MPVRLPFLRRLGPPFAGLLVAAGLLGGLAFFGGCSQAPAVAIDWRTGPFFAPTNVSGVAHMPDEVRRVAILPLGAIDPLTADTVAVLEAARQSALLAEGRFEVVPVPAALVRAATGKPAVLSTESLPAALFERVAAELGAEAVLFVEITAFQPYRPLALGVRAKLARCDESRSLLWALDSFYDARDPAVANSARRHASGGRSGIVDPGPAALQSPSRFAAYVFADAFATLPPRYVPPPTPAPTKVRLHRAD